MPLAVRVGLVGHRLQGWKSGSVPNFLALIAACRKEHADDRTRGIDAATVFAVEQAALAFASAVQVTDFAIESRFAKWRHLLADLRLAKHVHFKDINEFEATTFAASIAFRRVRSYSVRSYAARARSWPILASSAARSPA